MRVASWVVGAAVVLAACSGDDGGSVEAFCATARRFAQDNPANVFDQYAETADELAAAFEAPAPSAERAAELEEQFADVEEASGRVTGYAREQCAVDLDPAATVATAPSSTTLP
jgi:hypothetical protein